MNASRRIALALVGLALCCLPPALAKQGGALQKPPRITAGSLVKPAVTPGKFKPATLPCTLTPEKPINESGALLGYGTFDLSEGRIAVRSGETGQFVGMKVMLSKLNRPVTFEFEITGAANADDKIRLQMSERVRKPDGNMESQTLNMTTVAVFSMRQRLTITGSPSGEGWIMATATPATSGAAFEVVSVTVR